MRGARVAMAHQGHSLELRGPIGHRPGWAPTIVRPTPVVNLNSFNSKPKLGSTMATDLYAILGVSPAATQAEITRAYRILVRRHHPDTRTPDQGSPIAHREVTDDSGARHDTALQEVVAAYRVLRDPVRRAEYDRRHRPQPPLVRQPQRPTTPTVRTTNSEGPAIIAGPVHWERPRPR